MTWDRRLYFPSEGRRAGDFFALKNLTASAVFQPANLGTTRQHASSRPPKPLLGDFKNVMNSKCFHLFSFKTHEHNVYTKEFRFLFNFIFNLNHLTI
jgi:hypothetical protein